MKTSSRALIWVLSVFAAGIAFGTALTLFIVRSDLSRAWDSRPPAEVALETSDAEEPRVDEPAPVEEPKDEPAPVARPKDRPAPAVQPRNEPPTAPQSDEPPAVRQLTDEPPQIDEPAVDQRPSRGLDRREVLTRRIMRFLQLDAAQRIEVRRILEESRLRQQRARRFRPEELPRIRRETLQQIRAVLRPGQRVRLQRILRRLQQERTIDRR